MSKTNLIAALDIGSGKITAIAAAYDADSNSLKVVAGKSVPCKGLKKGMVSDIREASSSITEVIDYIEEQAGQDIGGLYIALRGEHLETFSNHGTNNITRRKEINADDIEQAILNARSIPIKPDHEVISVVPQGFLIDRQSGIDNPEGMEGSLLEVNVNITTGLTSCVNNIMKAFDKQGFRVDGKFYGLVCLADTVLSQEEKDSYCLIIDLGGETISVGIWAEGSLLFSKDFPFGCDVFTRDIINQLHTPKASAVKIKEKYGVAYPAYLEEESSIEVPSMDGKHTTHVNKSFLLDIIQPRAEEFFEIIYEAIEKAGYGDYLKDGYAVLTGGGSLMPGIASQCCQKLGLKEARIATVQKDLVDAEDKFFDPLYSTALSLAVYASNREMHSTEKSSDDISSRSPILRFINGIVNTIKNSGVFGG